MANERKTQYDLVQDGEAIQELLASLDVEGGERDLAEIKNKIQDWSVDTRPPPAEEKDIELFLKTQRALGRKTKPIERELSDLEGKFIYSKHSLIEAGVKGDSANVITLNRLLLSVQDTRLRFLAIVTGRKNYCSECLAELGYKPQKAGAKPKKSPENPVVEEPLESIAKPLSLPVEIKGLDAYKKTEEDARALIDQFYQDLRKDDFDPSQPYTGAGNGDKTPLRLINSLKKEASIAFSQSQSGLTPRQQVELEDSKDALLTDFTRLETKLTDRVLKIWKKDVEKKHHVLETLRETTALVVAEVAKVPPTDFTLITTLEGQLAGARADTNGHAGEYLDYLEQTYFAPATRALDALRAKKQEADEAQRLEIEYRTWVAGLDGFLVAIRSVLQPNGTVRPDVVHYTYAQTEACRRAIKVARDAAKALLDSPSTNPRIEAQRKLLPAYETTAATALDARANDAGLAEWQAKPEVGRLRTIVDQVNAIDINTQISPQNGSPVPGMCYDTTALTTGAPPGTGFTDRLRVARTAAEAAHLLDPSNGYEASEKAKRAIERIVADLARAESNLTKCVERSREKVEVDPSTMTLDQLANAIIDANIDVYDHGMYNNPQTPKFFRDLYAEFHKRKSAVSGETVVQMQTRIDFVMRVVLTKAEDFFTNEGQVPTATRPDIFPGLVDRQVSRHELLKATTYHPEYGAQIRFILDDLIERVADRNAGNEISYDVLTGSGEGKTKLKHFIARTYKTRLMGEIYQALPLAEREKKVDYVLELSNRLFILFDLMTVSFAELQKQTKTGAHQKTKKGVPVKDKDRVLLTRPDAALVHRMQRYDSPSDWSANWLLYMDEVPADYGKPGVAPSGISWRNDLVERQRLISEYQASFYDVGCITGTNGIPTSGLFDPTFPDTRSFLLLADSGKTAQNIPEMLEFGDRVYGIRIDGSYGYLGQKGSSIDYGGRQIVLKENVAITVWFDDTALTGWEKIIELTFGDLPSPLSEQAILESSSTGGADPDLGMIDVFINKGCSMAKMFPGNHMRDAVPVLFTHYIMRIFARYQAERRYKEHTYREVVKKLQNSTIGGGLAGYPEIAMTIIRNITANANAFTDSQLLTVDASRLKMSDNLDDGTYKRMRQRKEYLDELYRHKRMRLPAVRGIGGGAVTSIASAIDSTNQSDQRRYHAMLNGEQPLEDPGVNRRGSIYKVDKE